MATCLHPMNVKGKLIPCGKCPVCTQNKRQSLAMRFMLESANSNGTTAFITLTYDNDNLPYACLPNYNPPVVNMPHFKGPYGTDKFHFPYPCFDKETIQKFIKRLRKNTGWNFKYFITCEYGSLTHRPHYHGIFFFQNEYHGLFEMTKCIQSEWKYGERVEVSYANDNRLAYCAKYVLKDDLYSKLIRVEKYDLRKPFNLWSCRPGIGGSAIDFLNEYIFNDGNIRNRIEYNGNSITLDTYFKRHLDPSIVAELQYLNYYEPNKNAEIQEKLRTSLSQNTEVVQFGQSKAVMPSYDKDKEIMTHRLKLKSLKKHSLL